MINGLELKMNSVSKTAPANSNSSNDSNNNNNNNFFKINNLKQNQETEL